MDREGLCLWRSHTRKIAVSNNVGRVKHFSSTLRRALEKKRHFALADGRDKLVSTQSRFAAVPWRLKARPRFSYSHPERVKRSHSLASHLLLWT